MRFKLVSGLRFLLVVSGLLGLGLANAGLLNFSRPAVEQLSAELPPPQRLVAFTHVTLIPMDVEG